MVGTRWFVLRELARRDVEGRYAGSLLGGAWTVVVPLLQLVLFWFVFGLVVRIPVEGEGTSNFPLFLFGGLVPWLGINDGVLRGAMALSENAALLGRVSVPAPVLVWARVISALVHQIAATVVLAAIGVGVGLIRLSALPHLAAALVIEVLLIAGAASLLAPIVVVFRDLSQALPLALQALFYLSPIVYPVALVPESLAWVTTWNPVAVIAAAHRAVFLASPPPSPVALAVALAAAAALAWSGTVVLRRFALAVIDDL
jgi:lipopolysaccharide transport system permease protein